MRGPVREERSVVLTLKPEEATSWAVIVQQREVHPASSY
jgi:hypothetical protein